MTNTSFAVSGYAEDHRALDADKVVRSALFLTVFMLMWVSLHPFSSLADPPAPISEGGDLMNQVAFGGMFLTFGTWLYLVRPQGLRPLVRPVFVLMLAWFALSIVFSWEPVLALKRFMFAIIMLALSGITLLLPKDLRHFADMIAVAALAVLALCYFGVIFIPENAIHQATDFLEPEHAGSWRGVFPHKNQAGSMMVVLFFIGLFVGRVRSRGLGLTIAVLSLVFLVFTRSKTPIGLLPLAMVISAIVIRARRPTVGICIGVGVAIVINVLTLGSVYFEPIHNFLNTVMSDASFTGRTDIWKFAIGELAARPITGYGFGAFWGTEQVVFGMSGLGTWATAATDAHNGYLNIALTTGIPGLLLASIWLAVLPLADYYRLSIADEARPLAILFVRIIVFGLYVGSFEGSLFQQAGEFWFILALSIFGLRYLSTARIAL